MESLTFVIVHTGDVSVKPYGIVISVICIRLTTCSMTFTGQGEPDMIPVRSEEKSYLEKSGCSSMAMYMVGTPYVAVQRSAWIVCITRTG